ncbi:hypothetical protein [Ottowia sp.]|uniref:hypothetical protein n=1 Tax=Ottowia sp. TaxID=1898956 RepID=UPI003A86E64C
MPSMVHFSMLSSSALVVILVSTACTTPIGSQINQPGEFTGKVIGPQEFGQPAEGAGLRAYALQLAKPLTLDDKAECGKQTLQVLPIESDVMAVQAGKTVVLHATPYCRVSRSGKYHLKDVTVR